MYDPGGGLVHGLIDPWINMDPWILGSVDPCEISSQMGSGASSGLSKDPGPHAVFFSCVRRAGRGGGIQGVSVVVVVVASFDKTIEIREMVK